RAVGPASERLGRLQRVVEAAAARMLGRREVVEEERQLPVETLDLHASSRLPPVEEAILARHGESELSLRGLMNGDPGVECPLTPAGVDQAPPLGGLLAPGPRRPRA